MVDLGVEVTRDEPHRVPRLGTPGRPEGLDHGLEIAERRHPDSLPRRRRGPVRGGLTDGRAGAGPRRPRVPTTPGRSASWTASARSAATSSAAAESAAGSRRLAACSPSAVSATVEHDRGLGRLGAVRAEDGGEGVAVDHGRPGRGLDERCGARVRGHRCDGLGARDEPSGLVSVGGRSSTPVHPARRPARRRPAGRGPVHRRTWAPRGPAWRRTPVRARDAAWSRSPSRRRRGSHRRVGTRPGRGGRPRRQRRRAGRRTPSGRRRARRRPRGRSGGRRRPPTRSGVRGPRRGGGPRPRAPRCARAWAGRSGGDLDGELLDAQGDALRGFGEGGTTGGVPTAVAGAAEGHVGGRVRRGVGPPVPRAVDRVVQLDVGRCVVCVSLGSTSSSWAVSTSSAWAVSGRCTGPVTGGTTRSDRYGARVAGASRSHSSSSRPNGSTSGVRAPDWVFMLEVWTPGDARLGHPRCVAHPAACHAEGERRVGPGIRALR